MDKWLGSIYTFVEFSEYLLSCLQYPESNYEGLRVLFQPSIMLDHVLCHICVIFRHQARNITRTKVSFFLHTPKTRFLQFYENVKATCTTYSLITLTTASDFSITSRWPYIWSKSLYVVKLELHLLSLIKFSVHSVPLNKNCRR